MSADSPRRTVRGVPAIVPPQVVSDRSIIDSVAGFINDVTLTNQPQVDPKDTITWARFEIMADISDPTFGEDWELEGNAAPPLLLILGYGLGVQVWAIPANGEAVEVLSWRHGNVTALRVLPTPLSSDVEMAEEPIDQFSDKRPLMAICDGTAASCSSQFCSVNFVSLKEGAQIKTIKFKNPVLDILANRTSVVITFPERIAVFDARSLEDRLSVTSCYPSPGINPNPVALGSRWMAYSECKLIHSKRSGGGCEVDGVPSYTATVLNAAKSLGKGLRELGEQVAAGLTGTTSGLSSKAGSFDSSTGDVKQPGVITILDIKYPIRDISPTTGSPISVTGTDPIVVHFIAHSDAIVAMEFDYSGMLLLTADKRGHDFHVFRIQPHPTGSHLSAVHHLYILHRGDTSAKVQNIVFSLDSRWVAISTLRGTTHVFPIAPYGGPAGVRTHASLHVVNRLSRFHRSAGLSPDGRSSSPISSHSDSTLFNQICMPYNNPTIPPFPRPHIVLPLAQLRQPSVLGSPPGSAQNSYSRSSHGRQRLSSLSDDNGKPLSVCAIFAKARSWLLDPPNLSRDTPAHKIQRKAVDSLFIMAGHGALIQYDLDTKLASNVAKEKVCDDTPIELEVEAKAQWNLGRKETSVEIQPPLSHDNWLMKERSCFCSGDNSSQSDDSDDRNDRWLSQVEIITHAGPHRRLWMGPQCVFKTYNTPSGSPLSHIDTEAVEIGVGTSRPGRSSPLNMPLSGSGRSSVPVLIESGSYSSIEQSPKLMDRFRHEHLDSDFTLAHGESRLKEDLADAMRESPSVQHKDTGLTPRLLLSSQSTKPSTLSSSSSPLTSSKTLVSTIVTSTTTSTTTTTAAISKATISSSSDQERFSISNTKYPASSDATTTSYMSSSMTSSQNQPARSVVLIEKVVNPLGTVTTVTRSSSESEFDGNNPYGDFGSDYVIHENCDEALFRPVVAIFCDDDLQFDVKKTTDSEFEQPPEPISTELIVPVIEKIEQKKINRKGPGESSKLLYKEANDKTDAIDAAQAAKFEELSQINKKTKGTKKTVNDKDKKEEASSVTACKKSDQVILKCENENFGVKKKSSIIIEKAEKVCEAKSSDKSKDDTVMQSSSLFIDKGTSKARKSEEKEITSSVEKSSKVGVKSKKALKSEVESCSLSKLDSKTEIDKKKSEKQLKMKLLSDESNKKLPRVSSDSKISKLKTVSQMISSNVEASSAEEIKASGKNKVDMEKIKEDANVKDKTLSFTKPYIELENDDGGLHFCEKFTEDAPKSVKVVKNNLRMDDSEVDVDFPTLAESLADTKKTKKDKSTGSQTQSSKPTKKEKEEKLKADDNAIETVTFTLPMKKKTKSVLDSSSKKSELDCGNAKKVDDIVDASTSISEPNITETNSKTKLSKSTKKDSKIKDFPKLSLEALSADFSSTFLPPLSPLEPFDSKFESLHFKDASDDHVSLINFESPLQERTKLGNGNRSFSKDEELISIEEKSLKTCYTEDNLIFALCGSLHYDKKTSESQYSPSNSIITTATSTSTSTTTYGVESLKKYSKKDEKRHFIECDEQYLSLEPQEHTSCSSSEETEETTSNSTKKTHGKLTDDDEELRPLISGANSACSMASSTGGKKDDETPSSIALEIAKAIIDTLPDSNQSDSSDQANMSETGELEEIMKTIKDQSEHLTSNDSTAKQLSTAQLDLNNGTSGGAVQNGKKKSKKKKR